MSAKKTTRTPTKSTAAKGKTGTGWSPEERAAAKAYAQELKEEARGANDEKAALAAIAAMPPNGSRHGQAHPCDRQSQRAGPRGEDLVRDARVRRKDGKVICFFQSADKFKARYATFGFNDDANLDDGNMWPTSWALTKLTAADEKKIAALVKKAVR